MTAPIVVRKVSSQDLPAKKRKAFWVQTDSTDADLDPFADAPPEAKRAHSAGSDASEDRAAKYSLFDGMASGRLEDRFKVDTRVLGSGQFGTVRECRDKVTGERLACKSVPKSDDALAMTELRTEVELMGRVAGHANVVQLRGLYEDAGEVHLVMDLCRGGELFDEILRRHEPDAMPFSERAAALLFADLVRGVAFCHSRGVLHRDLKPENILLARPLPAEESVEEALSRGPLLKIADFGLSAAVAGQSGTAQGVAGSPFYMAPEVVRNQKYNSKADVWSLGVILYILLCGRPPFWGETDTETFKSIIRDAPDMEAAPWDRVSASAKALVRRLLAKDPKGRPLAHQILAHPWMLAQQDGAAPVKGAPAAVASLVSVPVA